MNAATCYTFRSMTGRAPPWRPRALAKLVLSVLTISSVACGDKSVPLGASSARGSASTMSTTGLSASTTPISTASPSASLPSAMVAPMGPPSGAPAASGTAIAVEDTGPCAEPRVLLSVHPPAEAPRAIERALRAIRNTPGLTLQPSRALTAREVRLETAEYAGRHFKNVDANRVALMAVCADRTVCAELADAYRIQAVDCRCEKMCAPPPELASKPLSVGPSVPEP